MEHLSKYSAITIIAVVAMALMFSVFVVVYTGSTDSLIAIGQMVALVVGAFRS
jgi:hypothetical protein